MSECYIIMNKKWIKGGTLHKGDPECDYAKVCMLMNSFKAQVRIVLVQGHNYI